MDRGLGGAVHEPIQPSAPAAAHRKRAAQRKKGLVIQIFVGNINWSTTQEDLAEIFVPFGGVGNIDVATTESGQPRGFAFVQMDRDIGLMAIAQLHGTRLKGRFINVREALPTGTTAEPRSATTRHPAGVWLD